MPNPIRVLAIGDIHGSAAALDALLAAVAPAAEDLVITLGDYVDGGIDSPGVIERLIRLSAACQLIPLRGNHEEMMMDARRGPEFLELWKRLGGDSTLISYAPERTRPVWTGCRLITGTSSITPAATCMRRRHTSLSMGG